MTGATVTMACASPTKIACATFPIAVPTDTITEPTPCRI